MSNVYQELIQASLDKVVSQKLGTIPDEFFPPEFGGDKTHATEVILGMMEVSVACFFAKMRKRIKEKREAAEAQRRAVDASAEADQGRKF